MDNSSVKSDRSLKSPRKFYAVGENFNIGDAGYKVIARSGVTFPREACLGCCFKNSLCPENIACSSFDRRDGTSVWFVRYEEDI